MFVKTTRRITPKLTLRKEQIRVLDQLDLARANGGDPPSSLCPTHRFCTLACIAG
jgi:hypothetical protein